jgi:hypothetical protein
MSRNVFLISIAELKARSTVGVNVDDNLVFPTIKAAQDEFIEPALGSALYTRMLDGIEADDLTADEETLRENYIAEALIKYVVSMLAIEGSFLQKNVGLIRRTADNAESPSMSDLLALSKWYQNKAEFSRERLIKYLDTNSDTFPLYTYNSDNDFNPAKSGYEINVDLGDDDESSCSDYYG